MSVRSSVCLAVVALAGWAVLPDLPAVPSSATAQKTTDHSPLTSNGGGLKDPSHPLVSGQLRPAYFLTDVMPRLNRLGCNAVQCHGAQNGKGGLKLSMFGASCEEDYLAITRSGAGRRIDRVEPARSLLILKVSGGLPHEGGKKVPPGSADYKLLVSWVAQGAPWCADNSPRLVSVKVAQPPPAGVNGAQPGRLCHLRKGESLQLAATAIYSDGSERDVTRDVLCRSSEPSVASVADGGKVTANDFGTAAIVVTYMRIPAVARVAVPSPLPTPLPDTPAPLTLPSPSGGEGGVIDELVNAKLKELGIPPSEVCSDAEFLRRVYLDVIGILPTPDEARAFLADKDVARRAKLIDRLLERGEFADFQALKWGDLLRIKSEYPINLWPNAVQAYHHWVRDSIATNKPYDRFATELLTSTGSNFRNPPSNYFRAVPKRDPQSLAEATALVFMGTRIACARCHGHPTENWTPDNNLGMAAFFAKVQYKASLEWKEEIVYFSPDQVLRNPVTKQPVPPKFLDGMSVDLPKEVDPRVKFAEWLTSPQNPWFAKNAVNRVWFWLLGRGIVNEPDDLRPTNPPTNPELLAWLEGELVSHQFDLKHIYRLILNSRTWQRSSKTDAWNAKDVAYFSHYPARRLGAEQLLDAIGQVTETSEPYSSRIPEPFTVLPDGFRATQLFDGSISTPFLELFGRPPRDTAYENDRSRQMSMRQALHLINSPHIEGRIAKSPRIQRLLKENRSDAEIVEEFYLAALSRPPSEEEKKKVVEYLGKDKKARTQAVQDFVWALLNTKEFLSNH